MLYTCKSKTCHRDWGSEKRANFSRHLQRPGKLRALGPHAGVELPGLHQVARNRQALKLPAAVVVPPREPPCAVLLRVASAVQHQLRGQGTWDVECSRRRPCSHSYLNPVMHLLQVWGVAHLHSAWPGNVDDIYHTEVHGSDLVLLGPAQVAV